MLYVRSVGRVSGLLFLSFFLLRSQSLHIHTEGMEKIPHTVTIFLDICLDDVLSFVRAPPSSVCVYLHLL